MVRVVGDFNCEYGAMRNLVGDRTSNFGGERGDEGGGDADHLTGQLLVVIKKHYIKNISRTESVIVGSN